MVKQGQPSPVVSLPFRLYWQLSDPTVWITIISHSPHCVPPVSQTYSQTKTPTCAQKNPTTEVSTRSKKNTLHMYLLEKGKKKLLAWTFHFCRALSDSIHNHCLSFPPFCAQFNRVPAGSTINVWCKTDIEKRYAISLRERSHTFWIVIWRLEGLGETLETPHSEGTRRGWWARISTEELSPLSVRLLWFLANGALHENISAWLHYLLARLTRRFWVTQITFTHDPHIQLPGERSQPDIQTPLCDG